MWGKITSFLNFTGVEDKAVWQDVVFSSLLIPIVIFLGVKFLRWWSSIQPSRLVLKDYLPIASDVYIFHSQMSAVDDNGSLKSNPRYVTRFPQPTPTDHANLGMQQKCNIDPVSSGADSECVADVFNILGSVRKTKNIFIADLINDWSVWSRPIFSIGFNPKTFKFLERCDPINFELVGDSLKIKNTDIIFDSCLPNDAGVVQKTFDRESRMSVIILAGLGTTGTSAAGYVLKDNLIKLGKLFGNNAFCLLFKVKIDEGKQTALIQKIIPRPVLFRIFLHPILYFHSRRMGHFDYAK